MVGIHSIEEHQQLVDRALDRISQINLVEVRMKLADPEEGKGWDNEMLDWAELEYRRFLALNYAYPDRTIVPEKSVDEFWHQHILDTRSYASDMWGVFGRFLHHFPYLGMRGPADEQKLVECYSNTRALYELHFGRSEANEIKTSKYRCGGGRCSHCARTTT